VISARRRSDASPAKAALKLRRLGRYPKYLLFRPLNEPRRAFGALPTEAARYAVASKVIATVDDLEQIAADDQADVAALQGWRRKLFGEAALKLKHGQIALAIEKGRVIGVNRS